MKPLLIVMTLLTVFVLNSLGCAQYDSRQNFTRLDPNSGGVVNPNGWKFQRETLPQENWFEKKNRIEAEEQAVAKAEEQRQWVAEQARWAQNEKDMRDAYEANMAEMRREEAEQKKANEAFYKKNAARRKALTPEQRKQEDLKAAATWQRLSALDAQNNAENNARWHQNHRENAARQRAQGDLNVFCHRLYGKSC